MNCGKIIYADTTFIELMTSSKHYYFVIVTQAAVIEYSAPAHVQDRYSAGVCKIGILRTRDCLLFSSK